MHDASGWTPAGSARGSTVPRIHVTVRGRNGPVSPATVLSAGLALYFLVEAFEPFSAFRLVLGIFTAAFTLRLTMRGTLIASPDGIEWRTILRTRRWPYEAVSYFDLALRSGGGSGSSTRVARIHLVDGRAQWLNGLEEQDPELAFGLRGSRRPSDTSAVEGLDFKIDALNKIVDDLRSRTKEREAG
jgi:hypothetical protein